jgi:5'-nucleotidase
VASSAVLVGAPAVADAAPKPKRDIPVQLIAMNDFHGRIKITEGADAQQVTAPGPDGAYGTTDDIRTTVGGSAHVAATVQRLQGEFRAESGDRAASYFVGAGDLVSASPFESSVFKDEPTVEVLNAMGLDVSSVGNHEFDRGTEELRRISAATDGSFTDDVAACEGITPGVDGCFGEDEHAFHGAEFPYLAANVISRETGEPMLPPFQVYNLSGGQKLGLIGVVTRDTANIVSPDGVADVEFIDEADAVNRWTRFLERRGVSAIGVLVHEGGTQTGPTRADPNACDTLSGPIVDLSNRTDDRVDLIVSAHTHQAYNCLLPVPGGHDRLVTSAGYYGRLVSDIRLTLDGRTGDVDRSETYAATNVAVARTASDARVQSIVDYWVARSAEAGNVVIGQVTADIKRAYVGTNEDRENESSLGNLVAQAQLEAMQQDQFGNPVIAFMNPGGLRADILYTGSPAGEGDGNVTFKEAFDVQPFGNTVNAVTLTGADIKQVLEEQFQVRGQRSRLILGTSEGFSYSYDLSQPFGSRVVANSITLNGATIDPAALYRVVANSFLIVGGDQFGAFTRGTDPVTGPADSDTTGAYFEAHSPVSPPPANHSTRIG